MKQCSRDDMLIPNNALEMKTALFRILLWNASMYMRLWNASRMLVVNFVSYFL